MYFTEGGIMIFYPLWHNISVIYEKVLKVIVLWYYNRNDLSEFNLVYNMTPTIFGDTFFLYTHKYRIF